VVFFLTGCGTIKPPANTLGELDSQSTSKDTPQAKPFVSPKSIEEVRAAYNAYLEQASVAEKSRIDALTRLAELEYQAGNQFIREKEPDLVNAEANEQDKLYQQRLNKTILLLQTSLEDYPNAKNNDSLLYQLAKARAQSGLHNESIESLQILAEKYPQSPFYVEAHFRIAEDAFARQDYSTAEFSYTEVIASPANDKFYEKSVFKRGWSRFKQEFYLEAVDDFLQAILNHEFGPFEKLSTVEREQFDEYFRAVGLAFSYLGGTEPLHRYFTQRPDFQYTYFTYSMVAELYFKQERFSDAVDTHEQFIKYFPESDNIPYSHLKIIEIWKSSGFNQKLYPAIEAFYQRYNPASDYWKQQNENSRVNRQIRRSLKSHVLQMATYYQAGYQNNKQQQLYDKAELWYERYLQHYSAYAQQDNVYYLFADLLMQKKRVRDAFKYYELAAFQDDQIINPEAAYAAIVTSDQLIKTSKSEDELLNKHLKYALRYTQQFTTDKRSRAILLNAAELAFSHKDYKLTIQLADIFLSQHESVSVNYVTSLKADAYYRLEVYDETEALYSALVEQTDLPGKQKQEFTEKLALAIYQQAEVAKRDQAIAEAINHFSRISLTAPSTEIAPTGLYDGIALSMQNDQWDQAINLIKRFRSLYPDHPLSPEVDKKLSTAYLNLDQGLKAAKTLEQIAIKNKNYDIQAAALWKAASLYAEKGRDDEAIRSYKEYLSRFKRPYASWIAAMHELGEIYARRGDSKARSQWLNAIIQADEKALNNVKTGQSNEIVSTTYLSLARQQKNEFDRLTLTLPLKNSLLNKKKTMQRSVKLFGQASINKYFEISTESTHSIGLIYKDFSQALLTSERPANLTVEQLDQYEILLEDQAFPFEDKAIEFFEINLARIQEGYFNPWIKSSLEQLIDLFPVRYDRQPKTDRFVTGIN